MKDKPEFTSTYKSVSNFRIEIITVSPVEGSSNAYQEFVQVNYLNNMWGVTQIDSQGLEIRIGIAAFGSMTPVCDCQ